MSDPYGARPSGPLEKACGPEGRGPSDTQGWHTRGYLPHFDATRGIQSITYRLADSLPLDVLRGNESELAHEPEEQRQRKPRRLIERFLDSGHGSCVLCRPNVARMVIDAWKHFAGQGYNLHAWVVMPNHIHVVCEPLDGYTLSSIINSWKSYTAVHINRLLTRSGSLWMEDYWDRYVRDADHYDRVVAYVCDNPVKAGLVSNRSALVTMPVNAFLPPERYAADHLLTACGVTPSARAISDGIFPLRALTGHFADAIPSRHDPIWLSDWESGDVLWDMCSTCSMQFRIPSCSGKISN